MATIELTSNHSINNYFKSIEQLKLVNAANGFYFFSPATMKFFKTKICGGIIFGRFFITQDYMPDKTYTVREIASDKGDIHTNPLNQRFATRKEAKEALKIHLNIQ